MRSLSWRIPLVQSIREGGDKGVPVMVGDDLSSKKHFEELQAPRPEAFQCATQI